MKSGIGNTANDKSANLSTRGLIDVLSIEIVDGSGNQIGISANPFIITTGGSSSVGDGTLTITNGVPKQLSTTSIPCKRVIITAHEGNAGTVVVGGSTVIAALVGRRGRALFPTFSEVFIVSNLNALYLDATAATGGTDLTTTNIVHFYYEI